MLEFWLNSNRNYDGMGGRHAILSTGARGNCSIRCSLFRVHGQRLCILLCGTDDNNNGNKRKDSTWRIVHRLVFELVTRDFILRNKVNDGEGKFID